MIKTASAIDMHMHVISVPLLYESYIQGSEIGFFNSDSVNNLKLSGIGLLNV